MSLPAHTWVDALAMAARDPVKALKFLDRAHREHQQHMRKEHADMSVVLLCVALLTGFLFGLMAATIGANN